MHFVCTMYALCMQFSPEVGNPSKSRAKATFSRFVCSVCSRFRSSSFFRRFPFKGTAYNAYKCIQTPPKSPLSPTADWLFAVCSWPGRKLHTENAYAEALPYPRHGLAKGAIGPHCPSKDGRALRRSGEAAERPANAPQTALCGPTWTEGRIGPHKAFHGSSGGEGASVEFGWVGHLIPTLRRRP